MSQEVIMLALHGMGDHKPNFDAKLKVELAERLGNDDWSQVYFDRVYYQDVFQDNQRDCFTRMKRRDIDWIKLRKFLLYGFSDAAGLERNAHLNGSPYEQAQQRILSALDKAYDFIGSSRPVVIIAQSLGCQLISNYLWDAQHNNPTQGVWKNGGPATDDSDRTRLRRLKPLKYLYTTGCNIPIFLAGLPKDKIKAVKTTGSGYGFKWKNYFDADDVLGWPLQPLSESYKNAVDTDAEVNADGGFFGALTQSWNPFSHGNYWTDSDVLKPLVRDIRSLLP